MKIIHLSDMHFGTQTPSVVDALLQSLQQTSADLIVITGDFTQRALKKQFLQAKEFLNLIKGTPTICVPGNHDISLHNLWERYFRTFDSFHHYLFDTPNPSYQANNVAILGINSVTPFRVKDGYIGTDQLTKIKEYFHDVPKTVTKIVFMHHNLIQSEKHRIILNSEELIKTLTESRINIILAGHLHYACVERVDKDYISQPMYIVTAGTATSRRIRSQQNSFNVININNAQFTLCVKEYNGEEFCTLSEVDFSLKS